MLAPVPRGSQLTMSNRPPANPSKAAPAARTFGVPATPGPPKFMNSDPIRLRRSRVR